MLERSTILFRRFESLEKLKHQKRREAIEKIIKEINEGTLKLEDVAAPHSELLMMQSPPRAAVFENVQTPSAHENK